MAASDEATEKELTWRVRRSQLELHNNDSESAAERITEIRNWLLDCDELNGRTDDFFIVRFLRSCKFDIERSKQKLKNYYIQRSLSPDWFSNRNPYLPEVQELLDLGVFLPLKKADSQGRLIVVVRPCVHDPSKHKHSDVFKVSMMILDLATRDHFGASMYGIVVIHDMAGVKLAHGLQMTPGIIKRLVHLWQGYPNRLSSIDYINAPTHVNVVLNIFKSFMSKKQRERVHVHTNSSFLFNKISRNLLPAELGGTEENYESLKNYWKNQAEDNEHWFIEDEKFKLII